MNGISLTPCTLKEREKSKKESSDRDIGQNEEVKACVYTQF